MKYSIIVPFYNEEMNIQPFHNEIEKVLVELKNEKREFEIIYVDDGSKDKTKDQLRLLRSKNFILKLIFNKTNLSQSKSIENGVKESKFENLIFIDGDMQNDPRDLDEMLKIFEKKELDMLIGWRKNRKDNLLKTLPSLIANFFIRLLTKAKVHDNGCALKILKKKILFGINLWGDFHRLLALRVSELDFKVEEIIVNHRVRKFGKSKYSFKKIFNVIIDIIFIKLFYNSKKKSFYVFGNFSLLSFLLSLFSLVYMVVLKFKFSTSFIETPLPLLSGISFLIGLIFLSIGALLNILENKFSFMEEKNYDVEITS